MTTKLKHYHLGGKPISLAEFVTWFRVERRMLGRDLWLTARPTSRSWLVEGLRNNAGFRTSAILVEVLENEQDAVQAGRDWAEVLWESGVNEVGDQADWNPEELVGVGRIPEGMSDAFRALCVKSAMDWMAAMITKQGCDALQAVNL